MLPKPEPRRREKARRKRAEAKAMWSAWEETLERDGPCRLQFVPDFGSCEGVSEFAHVGKFRRHATRGMAPERRHSRIAGCHLCSGHHRTGRYAYDRHTLDIEPLDDVRYCDGPLRFRAGDLVYEEPA